MSYIPLTPTLVSSFEIPNGYRAFGMAPAGENKVWILVFNWPMVILVDSTGHTHCTGYVFKDMKKILEDKENTPHQHVYASGFEGYRIAAGCDGSCLVLVLDRNRLSIKEIKQTGTVSTVISGLDKLDVQGVAYLPLPTGKGIVLFGEHKKGLRSINWPKSFLSGLFSSPAPASFTTEFEPPLSPLCIAVDRNSDLLSVYDIVSSKVFVINRQGQKVSQYKPEDTEYRGLTFDHTGCIIVHNLYDSSVLRLSPDGRVVQTLFPEIKEDAKFCERCNTSKEPTCCKDIVRITAVSMEDDLLWVARLSGHVEIYKLH